MSHLGHRNHLLCVFIYYNGPHFQFWTLSKNIFQNMSKERLVCYNWYTLFRSDVHDYILDDD